MMIYKAKVRNAIELMAENDGDAYGSYDARSAVERARKAVRSQIIEEFNQIVDDAREELVADLLHGWVATDMIDLFDVDPVHGKDCLSFSTTIEKGDIVHRHARCEDWDHLEVARTAHRFVYFSKTYCAMITYCEGDILLQKFYTAQLLCEAIEHAEKWYAKHG